MHYTGCERPPLPIAGKQRTIVKEAAPWLEYKGRWGSTVEAPAQQEWFAKAEHPVSRSFLKQVRETVRPFLVDQPHFILQLV